jgi:hypothetical protein
MKILTLLFFVILQGTQIVGGSEKKTEHHHRATYLTNAIFGKSGTQSKISHQEAIEKAMGNILRATENQKIAIAQRTAQLLEHHIQERQVLLEQTPNNPALIHALFILKAQKGYLEEYYEGLLNNMSLFEQYYANMKILFSLFINSIIKFFTQKQSFIEETALDLDFYCYFEVEHIFIDYQKTLMLFSQQKHHTLPDMLLFWTHPLMQQEILKRVKQIDKPATIQAEFVEEVAKTEAAIAGSEGAITLAEEGVLKAATTEVDSALAEAGAAKGVAKNVIESLDKDLAQDFAEDAPKPGEEPAQTRIQERQAQRAQERAETAQKNEEALNDPKTSKIKKAYIKTKIAINTVLEKTGVQKGLDWIADNITGPISDAYKKYIYERFLEPLEDNALNNMMEELPEWLHGIVDIGLQMGIMMGGGLVTSWVSEADQKLYLKYAQLQTQMAAINTRIITQFAQQKALLMKSSSEALNAVINLINQTRSDQITNTAAEIVYLNKAVLNTPPNNAFVIKSSSSNTAEDALQIDERFARSVMPTSNLKSIWRNLFRSGNWQYIPDSKLFYQTQLVKIAGENVLEQATNCLYNSVITEYYRPATDAYDIIVECTLINYDTSCLVGVVFNNARWISGIPDTLNQHRLAGLYVTNNNFYGVLEESTPAPDQKNPTTWWPAYKILSTSNNYTQKNITALTVPVTLTFSINTSDTKVVVAINQNVQGISSTIAQLERTDFKSSLFRYHGLGFIAAGCIAQFKIIKPQELT